MTNSLKSSTLRNYFDDQSLSMETLRIGDRFDPTKLELVMYYLRNKVKKGKNGYITDMDVYENEPWLLQHVTPHPQFMEREWFYFVPTTQGGGSKPKRIVHGSNGEGGTWRSIDRERKSIKYNKVTVGYKQSFVYCTKVKGNPKEKRTDWYMKEFSLCDDELQNWVLCKIQHKTSENKVNNIMKAEQKEEGGLADEVKIEEDGEQQQGTHVLLPQGQDSGFETTQSNNTIRWDDLIYELQKLTKIQDSREFADQDIVGDDMMMYCSNRGLEGVFVLLR